MDGWAKLIEPYLKNFHIFEGLSCDEARKLGHMVIDKHFKAKVIIFSADEKAEYVYLIREGHVKLYRQTEDGRENIIAILGPGDVFGEFVFAEETCHSMFAEAFENSLLCILPRKNVLKLLLDEPAIALTIINNIGKRLSQTAYFIENLSTYDLTLRLGKLLLLLAGEYGSKTDASKIKIRLTHQDIANMIATSRQIVTTLINQFKELGFIRYEGRGIIVNCPLLSDFIEKKQQAKS